MLVVPDSRGPHRTRPFAAMPQVAEATGPPSDDRDRLDDARQAGRLRMIERRLERVERMMEQMLTSVRADTIAPMPRVYEDGEGGES